jgi:hypothetical protein
MFIDEQTGCTIHANLDSTVIRGTHVFSHLHMAFMCVIRDTPEYVQMWNAVPAHAIDDDRAEWWSSEDGYYAMEDLFGVLESYAPLGYYFGAHPGDGSDFGYWKIIDND